MILLGILWSVWSKKAINDRRAKNETKIPDWIRLFPAHRLHAPETKIKIEASEMAVLENKIEGVRLFLTL